MNHAQIVASGVMWEYLDRWSDEIKTSSALFTLHPNASDCARQRAKEAELSYRVAKHMYEKLSVLGNSL